jgi:hypothetical protein
MFMIIGVVCGGVSLNFATVAGFFFRISFKKDLTNSDSLGYHSFVYEAHGTGLITLQIDFRSRILFIEIYFVSSSRRSPIPLAW